MPGVLTFPQSRQECHQRQQAVRTLCKNIKSEGRTVIENSYEATYQCRTIEVEARRATEIETGDKTVIKDGLEHQHDQRNKGQDQWPDRHRFPFKRWRQQLKYQSQDQRQTNEVQ